MDFARHTGLVGKHSRLSASNNAWLNYDDDKFDRVVMASVAAQHGTRLHELAKNLIELGVKLPATSQTLNLYVNDAIGLRMSPEVALYYSDHAFCTADAVGFKFDRKTQRGKLRIHDLKTGDIPSGETQVKIYCAYFCLEYGFKPFELDMECRIYQNDEVFVFEADPTEIFHIQERIVYLSKRLQEMEKEGML